MDIPTPPFPVLNIPEAKIERVYELVAQHREDKNLSKCNLLTDMVVDDQFFRPGDIACMRAKYDVQDPQNLFADPTILKTNAYHKLIIELMLGDDHYLIKQNRIPSMQTFGERSAYYITAAFLKRTYEPWKQADTKAKVYIPAEYLAKHWGTFAEAGIQAVMLPYYDHKKGEFNFEVLTKAISALPLQSVVILQPNTNNSARSEDQREEWKNLAQALRTRHHTVIFDVANIGLIGGSFYKDSWCIRELASLDLPFLIAATFDNTFGKYGDHVGIFCIVAANATISKRIEREMELLPKIDFDPACIFCAKVIETVLTRQQIRETWEAELGEIACKLKERRTKLFTVLHDLGTPGNWTRIFSQRGMFLYLGLTAEQMKELREVHHVYAYENSRISIAGLNKSNVKHIAGAIDTVVREAMKKEERNLRSSKHTASYK